MKNPATSSKTTKTTKRKEGKGQRNRPYDPLANPNNGRVAVPAARPGKRPRTLSLTESQSATGTDTDVAMEQKSDQPPVADPNDWANWPFDKVQSWAITGADKAPPPRDPSGCRTAVLKTGSSRGETLVALQALNAGVKEGDIARGRLPKELVIKGMTADKWKLIQCSPQHVWIERFIARIEI